MSGWEGLLVALLGGILTSTSPCALAAIPVTVGYVGSRADTPRRAWWLSFAFVLGMNLTLLGFGLLAARMGLLFGNVSGTWSILVGALLVAAALWLGLRPAQSCGLSLPVGIQQKFAHSGTWGAIVLGGLIGTVLSPCATPALAAVLTLVSTGSWLGASLWWGMLLLLVYGIGHSILLFVAGAMPATANTLIRQIAQYDHWLPGRRTFAMILLLAGSWWVWQGIVQR
ncbi:MAG: cytochrome c biogenesis protein CcdA [Thiothrix sp.]|uniref:cytochrome c biogenesis CcdA family protein n=1 Tax=Thiothrix sp. TaxID=1032 RepID=UPI00260CD3BC|nr:cytochrome c biogenesis protein CcdA [Thiothrix sp.]MDD5393205.1 cytochrome c biogenesis protein CcdA [Thiothrix sp.]